MPQPSQCIYLIERSKGGTTDVGQKAVGENGDAHEAAMQVARGPKPKGKPPGTRGLTRGQQGMKVIPRLKAVLFR